MQKDIAVGDWVQLNTKYGTSIGIVEIIHPTINGKSPMVRITVRRTVAKSKTYHRKLNTLQKVEL